MGKDSQCWWVCINKVQRTNKKSLLTNGLYLYHREDPDYQGNRFCWILPTLIYLITQQQPPVVMSRFPRNETEDCLKLTVFPSRSGSQVDNPLLSCCFNLIDCYPWTLHRWRTLAFCSAVVSCFQNHLLLLILLLSRTLENSLFSILTGAFEWF